MSSVMFGKDAAFAVVDEHGHTAAEDTAKGFDEMTIAQIRETMRLQAESQK